MSFTTHTHTHTQFPSFLSYFTSNHTSPHTPLPIMRIAKKKNTYTRPRQAQKRKTSDQSFSSSFPPKTPRHPRSSPRPGTPSPRKKRNNSTPTKKNVNEKKQILQQLVSPAQNAATKVSVLSAKRVLVLLWQSANRTRASIFRTVTAY